MKKNLFAFVLTAIIPALCFGETPAAEPVTVTATPSQAKPPLNKAAELATWQAELAAGSYKINPSDRNLSNLLSAYEKLIAFHCMPRILTSLAHDGKENNEECKRYISMTLALDNVNPIAICAQDGIESPACEDAYLTQQYSYIAPGVQLWPADEGGNSTSLDIQLDISAQDEDAILKIENELSRVRGMASVSAKSREENSGKLRELSRKFISLACKLSILKIDTAHQIANFNLPPDANSLEVQQQLAMLPPEERDAILKQMMKGQPLGAPAATAQPTPVSPIEDLFKSLSPKKAPEVKGFKPRPDGIVRTRFVSIRCNNAIETSLSIEPGNAPATCAKFGTFSPHCIQALRKERIRLTSEAAALKKTPLPGTPTPAGPTKNFSTF